MSDLMKHPCPWVFEEMPNRCGVFDANGDLVTGDMTVANVVGAINALAAERDELRRELETQREHFRREIERERERFRLETQGLVHQYKAMSEAIQTFHQTRNDVVYLVPSEDLTAKLRRAVEAVRDVRQNGFCECCESSKDLDAVLAENAGLLKEVRE
jgi:hypothetical protein